MTTGDASRGQLFDFRRGHGFELAFIPTKKPGTRPDPLVGAALGKSLHLVRDEVVRSRKILEEPYRDYLLRELHVATGTYVLRSIGDLVPWIVETQTQLHVKNHDHLSLYVVRKHRLFQPFQ